MKTPGPGREQRRSVFLLPGELICQVSLIPGNKQMQLSLASPKKSEERWFLFQMAAVEEDVY